MGDTNRYGKKTFTLSKHLCYSQPKNNNNNNNNKESPFYNEKRGELLGT